MDSLTPKFTLFPLHHAEKLGKKGQSIENLSGGELSMELRI